jgi:hypothetical protein
MANLAGRRMMAEIDGDFVVFLIGARFNSFHLLKTVLDLGGRRGMKHMLDYLVEHPEKGLLGYQMGLPIIVQYWRLSSTWKPSPRTPATLTSRCGGTTGAGSARAPEPESGTRPTWCGPVSMRPCTATCPRSDWARRAGSCRCQNPRPPGAGSRRPSDGRPPGPVAERGRRAGPGRRISGDFTAPMLTDPGQQFIYGINIDWADRRGGHRHRP